MAKLIVGCRYLGHVLDRRAIVLRPAAFYRSGRVLREADVLDG